MHKCSWLETASFVALMMGAFGFAGCGQKPDLTSDSDSGIRQVQQRLSTTLEAESGTVTGAFIEGGGESPTTAGANKVFFYMSGGSVCWNTDMTGVSELLLHYGNGEPAGDSLLAKFNGATLGSMTVQNTSGWNTPLLTDGTISFASQSGTGNLCIEASGANAIASLDYVVLSGSSGCTPDCSGKVCGDDGCGNSCGSCGTGEACTSEGECEPICTPDCNGKTCGDDGCGNSCGSCQTGEVCTAGGQCTATCTPDCSGKVCGDDGCGGSCGTCQSGEYCTGGGQCATSGGATETRRFEAESATLLGCTIEGAGDSGDKVVNFHDNDSICFPSTDMDGVNSVTVHVGNAEPAGDMIELAYEGTTIASFSVPSTGGWSSGSMVDLTADLAGATAGSGTLCVSGSGSNWLASVDYVEVRRPLCTPDCSGRVCGDDGCGGSCGTCANPYDTCNGSGQCDACVPDCTGKVCGSDGCGGSCGTCQAGDSCDASGQCQACVPDCSGKTCGDDGCGGSCGTCQAGESCDGSQNCSPPGRAQYVPAGYSYLWGDDFGGVVGQGQAKSSINQAYWTFQNLHVNDEAQNYSNKECSDPAHTNDWNYCVEDGRLRIQGRAETLNCSDNGSGGPVDPDCADHFGWNPSDMRSKGYTSGRLITKNKVAHRYGYIEFRVRLPHYNKPTPPSGSWTAVWMLGQNIGEGPADTSRQACTVDTDCNTLNFEYCDKGVCAVNWPWTGENDVMEWKSRDDHSEMAHNIIWIGDDGNYQACNAWPEGGDTNCGRCFGGTCDIVAQGANGRYIWNEYPIDHTQYHTYGLLWTPHEKTYYLDGVMKSSLTIGPAESEFQKDMFLIMNYALGGHLGGQINITDWSDAHMDVDYIEWYQSATCEPNCTGKTCGDDGCGGICGTCAGGQICNDVSVCTGTLEAENGLYDKTDAEVIKLENVGGEGRLVMKTSSANVCWTGVNMDGVTGVEATYANGEPGGVDELVVRYDGNMLGNVSVGSSGSWGVDTDSSISFAAQSGSGTICVEAAPGGPGWIAALNSITLLK